MAGYAIISLGGKQYRVQEGQRLLVDRVATEEGKTFSPSVLLVADDDTTEIGPSRVSVTARVLAHVRGDKVTIGKYRPKSGYRRKTGFRAALTHVEIERIGGRGGSAGTKASATKEATQEADAQREERPHGMPKGYEELTVAQIAEAAPGWRRPMLEAALEYERAHAARKGAIAAITSALAAKEDT